jgi:hypothetical protein
MCPADDGALATRAVSLFFCSTFITGHHHCRLAGIIAEGVRSEGQLLQHAENESWVAENWGQHAHRPWLRHVVAALLQALLIARSAAPFLALWILGGSAARWCGVRAQALPPGSLRTGEGAACNEPGPAAARYKQTIRAIAILL